MSAKHASRAWLMLVLMLLIAGLLFVAYVGFGTVWIPLGELVSKLFHPDHGPTSSILWNVRLPRAVTCVVAGAIIGVVGSSFQALFRNPLAEPYVVGVSSGASIGCALALLLRFGAGWSGFAMGMGPMLAGLPFGLLSLALVFGLARSRGVIEVQTLLLAGVVVASMLSALLTFLLLAAGQDTGQVLRWLLGHTDSVFWGQIAFLGIALALGVLTLFLNSRYLNALTLGEDTAQRLGVDVGRLKPVVLVTGTVLVSLSVGAVGIIGFLGLVAPHIARRVVGIDWRFSLLASGLIGSALLLVSDLVAQRALGFEIPVGIVTAIIGAPFLLVLLKKRG